MSHVVKCKIKPTDLDALSAACDTLGLELRRGQKTYHWWGHSVGDYPLPAGFKASDLGHCEHAIRIKGDSGYAYEIGVVKAREGSGYELLFDFYGDRGKKIADKVGGREGHLLLQRYGIEAARNSMPRGFSMREETQANGDVVIRMVG
jgi:hypothetical protein